VATRGLDKSLLWPTWRRLVSAYRFGQFRESTVALTSPVSAVLADLEGLRVKQDEFYRPLHQHPELSHQERVTAAAVVERLQAAGFWVHDGVGGTGVVGVLSNGDGPTVLLRADTAALPVREMTGLAYAGMATGTTDND
jgi:metal-dependent amidase/aminoacylase/carboxypeptidase family protein